MPTEHEIMIILCTVLLGCIAIVASFHCLKLFFRNPIQIEYESEEQSGEDPQSIQIIVKSSPLRIIRVRREEDPVAPV